MIRLTLLTLLVNLALPYPGGIKETNFCAHRKTGLFSQGCSSNVTICNSFGHEMWLLCPFGLVFDGSIEECVDYRLSSECSAEDKQSKSGIRYLADLPRQFCSNAPEGFHALTDCASSVILCTDKVPSLMECPVGLVYDNSKFLCVKTSEMPSCPSPKPKAQSESETAAQASGSNPSQAESELEQETKDMNECDKLADGLFEHEKCSPYFLTCSGGVARIMSCPANLVFDKKLQICEYPGNVEECEGIAGSGAGEVCTEDGFFSYGNCSDLFFACTNGRKIPMYCPAKLAFDETRQLCDYPLAVEACVQGNSGEGSGYDEASGESSGEASSEASGENSGEASGESSGEGSGGLSGEASENSEATGESSGNDTFPVVEESWEATPTAAEPGTSIEHEAVNPYGVPQTEPVQSEAKVEPQTVEPDTTTMSGANTKPVDPEATVEPAQIEPQTSTEPEPVNPYGAAHSNPEATVQPAPVEPDTTPVPEPVNPYGTALSEPAEPGTTVEAAPVGPGTSTVPEPVNPNAVVHSDPAEPEARVEAEPVEPDTTPMPELVNPYAIAHPEPIGPETTAEPAQVEPQASTESELVQPNGAAHSNPEGTVQPAPVEPDTAPVPEPVNPYGTALSDSVEPETTVEPAPVGSGTSAVPQVESLHPVTAAEPASETSTNPEVINPYGGVHSQPEAKVEPMPEAVKPDTTTLDAAKLSVFCAKKPDSFYAFGCSSEMIACVAGMGTVMRCPAHLIFNEQKQICDYPENVPCSATKQEDLGKCEKEGTTSQGPCSNVFTNCVEGKAYTLACEDGYIFSEEHGTCTEKSKVRECVKQ